MTLPCKNRAHSPKLAAGQWRCDDCTAGTAPSPLAAALAARDEAEGKVTASEWSTFVAAVKRVAAENGGEVDANKLRPLIRGRIEPKHIASAYRKARSTGLLVEHGANRSDDHAGKNAGRLQPTYRYAA